MTFKNNRAPLLCYLKLCASFCSHWWIQTGDTVRKPPNLVKIDDSVAAWPWNLTDDLQNNRSPVLCHFKLCVSFRCHRWIQTGVTVRKRPIWVKIDNFWSRVTLKFDGWPWKTIGHLFYATSSFVHHFVAIGEIKLELLSGNAQYGSNSTIFRGCDLEIWRMTLKNNRIPPLNNTKRFA